MPLKPPAPAADNSTCSTSADLQLAAACTLGDVSARRELVGRLFDRVRRTSTYLAGPTGEAEDLAQNALIKILGSTEGYRGECPLEFWADRIAIRVVMKHIHKSRRRERLTEAIWEPARDTRSVDDEASLRAVRRRLAAKLQELNADRRVAVVLHHVEGYRIEEISDITGAPVNTIRDRLRKGRAQMRKKLLADPALGAWVKSVIG